jgi:hypothetical protein
MASLMGIYLFHKKPAIIACVHKGYVLTRIEYAMDIIIKYRGKGARLNRVKINNSMNNRDRPQHKAALYSAISVGQMK